MKIRRIKDYPRYFVSTNGAVLFADVDYYTSEVLYYHELKPRLNNSGYGRVRIPNENGYKELLVHRLVAQAFIPNPNNLPTVNHIDGDKTNNTVGNLEWLSIQDNIKHYRIDKKHKVCYTGKRS